MSRPLLLSLAGVLALAACDRTPDATPAASAPAPAPEAATHAFSPAIAAPDFAEHVRMLASDEFEGRAPGGVGEEKTVQYLQAQFARMGLKPGFGDSWFQTVPMIETTADESAVLRLDVGGQPQELRFGTDMVIGTRTGQASVSVKDSDLVFVGYGVNAPEQKWNDYAGVDVKGKTVVMFVNDPGFHANDPTLFEGKRMTYYGRWTYKFEEAARQGAAAALLIHDDAGAAYDWGVVKNSWTGPQFDLRAEDDPAPRLPIQGWIHGDAAQRLFSAAGLDLAKLRDAAGKRGFKPVPMKAKAAVTLASQVAQKSSRNVAALLPGSGRPEEAVVYMAHWDHLGKHPDEPGDNIYNGAIDNATGVAGILEIAERFANEPAPRRSLLFLAVTLEESGLLGSKYYVAHPAVPMERTVAVVNLDAMSVYGPSKDMVVTGLGNSELEDILKPIAAKQGRVLRAESAPEAGYYFRSDHFNFAKAGVPALYAEGGEDLVAGGPAAGKQQADDYYASRYHKPSDEFDPAWNLEGVVQDLDALHAVGRELVDGDRWPNWYGGNPFRAARDAAMAEAGKR